MAINPELMQVDGGGAISTLNKTKAQLAKLQQQLAAIEASQPAPATTVDTRAALAKLTSNQPLTDDEKRALGLLPPLASKTPVVATEDQDSYYTVKVGNTGKTQAQLDALKGAVDTAGLINQQYGAGNVISQVDPLTGKVKTDTSKIKVSTPEEIAAQEAAAKKAAADKAAAEAAEKAKIEAAKAEAARIAAEKAVAEAKTAKELAEAKDALIKANAEAARIAAEAKAAADKAAADAVAAKAAADKAVADAIAAGKADAIKAAQDAAATATATAKAAAEAAAAAAAEATAKAAQSNVNVSGNVVTTPVGKTAADVAAEIELNRLAEVAKAKEEQRQSTITILTDRFTKYNLGSLANKIKALAIDGANEATITLALQESDEYKERFKANEARVKNNLSVLAPMDYLNAEDSYRQTLRAYGLTRFDTDEYVQQFIENDTSSTEINKRIVTAIERVQNTDPTIIKTLRDFYGIRDKDLVEYVLDPEKNIDVIQKQLTAAEIGNAARMQGLNTGMEAAQLAAYEMSAAQLAAQGVTQAEAKKNYATIADILPTSQKLSEIYGTTLEKYDQKAAEQELFGSLASAQRAREKLKAREIAQFGGSSGLSRTALTSERSGNI